MLPTCIKCHVNVILVVEQMLADLVLLLADIGNSLGTTIERYTVPRDRPKWSGRGDDFSVRAP